MSSKVITTYRVDYDLLKAVQARAREAGETVTGVITRAFEAYIRGDALAAPVYTPSASRPESPGEIRAKVTRAREAAELGRKIAKERKPARKPSRPRSAAPSAGTAVFTAPGEEPVVSQPVPERVACPHPRARVNKGLCGACGTYVGAKP